LVKYSRGANWSEITRDVARRLERALAPRLIWAGLLHRLLFHPLGRAMILPMTLQSQFLWGRAFALTRQ
jgi:hypothetical protein